MRLDCNLDLLGIESTVLQEPHLARLLREISRQTRTKLSYPHVSCQFEPVLVHFLQRIFGN